MKKLLAVVGIIFAAQFARAGTDRFGNARAEIPRSSFTETDVSVNVILASATENLTGAFPLGGLVFRSIVFSGIIPTTVAVYDACRFTNATSTRAKIAYIPIIGGGGATGASEIPLNIFFSSGIMINKIGAAPVIYTFDYLNPPPYGGNYK